VVSGTDLQIGQGKEMEPAGIEQLPHAVMLAQDGGDGVSRGFDHHRQAHRVMSTAIAIMHGLEGQAGAVKPLDVGDTVPAT